MEAVERGGGWEVKVETGGEDGGVVWRVVVDAGRCGVQVGGGGGKKCKWYKRGRC